MLAKGCYVGSGNKVLVQRDVNRRVEVDRGECPVYVSSESQNRERSVGIKGGTPEKRHLNYTEKIIALLDNAND